MYCIVFGLKLAMEKDIGVLYRTPVVTTEAIRKCRGILSILTLSGQYCTIIVKILASDLS